MDKLKLRIEAKVKDLKTSHEQSKLQNTIRAAQRIRASFNNPVKGRGSMVLENIGKLLPTSSSEGYAKCDAPDKAAKLFLNDFDYWVETYQNPIKYQSDDSILIFVDGDFFQITQKEIRTAIPEMAHRAKVPLGFCGNAGFRNLVFEGMMKTFRRLDPSFNEIEKTILGK